MTQNVASLNINIIYSSIKTANENLYVEVTFYWHSWSLETDTKLHTQFFYNY